MTPKSAIRSPERGLKRRIEASGGIDWTNILALLRPLVDEEAGSVRGNGRNWARTSDLQVVELALSQLSYTPRGG